MPLSHDVNLPKDQHPRFPNRCVACGEAGPETSLRFTTRAVGWWTVAMFAFGKRFAADARCCAPCKAALRRTRRVRLAITIVTGMLAALGAVWLLAGKGGPLRVWLTVGVALVLLVPVFTLEFLYPPTFDMTAFSETVDYEFCDETYAREFAELNGGEVS